MCDKMMTKKINVCEPLNDNKVPSENYDSQIFVQVLKQNQIQAIPIYNLFLDLWFKVEIIILFWTNVAEYLMLQYDTRKQVQ